ncbi:glycosyltransferase [Patescibacteria group bacterium]|nr:glycosyltransferase [Patescibacteria group bacterium]
MRIAILTNAYPPTSRGGAGRIAFLHKELLEASGHEVRVWYIPFEWTRYAFIARVFFHIRDLFWIHPSAKELVAWHPDWLMSHNLTGIGFRTPSAIQAHGIPWAHVLHDVQLFAPSGYLASWQERTIVQRLATFARRLLLGTPNQVISPTETLWKAHRERGFFANTDHAIIPNCAPAERVRASTRHTPFRVGFIGRWSDDKGAALIESLWPSFSDAELSWQLFGPGTEHVSPPNGKGYGPQSSEMLLEKLSEIDVLLVPSLLMENQPTVILEAAACGVPVIASDQAGIRETLQDKGVLCAIENKEAWVHAIRMVIQESDQSYEARCTSFQELWRRYDPKLIRQRLVEVLTSKRNM